MRCTTALSIAALQGGILFALPAALPPQSIPAGELIERFACRDDPGQTYALYLPSSYDPARRYPIVYAFDPGARGARPVERFKEAAEKYGFIVVGSNNSRNGPWAPTVAAFQAMWQDTHSRLAIDDRRVYMAGLSGGARVACRFGYALKGQVAGVIACSAGLPAGIEPSASMPFALFATAGTDDFNYSELKRLHRILNDFKFVNRFEVFDGGHEWAPSGLCVTAIEWMELQAMKTGAREKNEAFAEAMFRAAVDRAQALQASGQLYGAWKAYNQLAADFRGLREVGEFEKNAARLKDSKEVAQALKRDAALETEERRRSGDLQAMRASIGRRARSSSGAFSDASGGASDDSDSAGRALSDLRRLLADLKKKSEAAGDSDERAMARRLLNGFVVAESEGSASLIQEKKYDLAAEMLKVDAELMPDRPRVLFSLACAYALSGNKKRALDALSKAVEKGFNILEELQRNPALDLLRQEPAFNKIVEELRLKTKASG